ncbi:Topoisomerase 1-associated factor 1 [Ophidiomyces ophidiicola]|nr:Topoisomerase 1-associated factor 1 [Ophidiomyces ophidiicola]
MDIEPSQPTEAVDSEVRGYVYSLVTALGGTAGDESGQYVLGDDALGCLRDLKKWLKFYDDKLNRLDVARCLAERQLVAGDLVPIISLYSDTEESNKHKTRVLLACLELLVPLTWPVEVHNKMTVNHHRHTPFLQYSQIEYKREILGFTPAPILRTIIRIGLPCIAVPRSDRSSRDEGIIKLMLYFFRNLAMVTPSKISVDGDDDQASRSATINAFQQQDVFAFLLTLCSNMGNDFTLQDTIIVEILFHLVKGVDIKQLFSHEKESTINNELRDILHEEFELNRGYAKDAPTRHGRFGTMIWVKREDEKVSTVSGQDVLKGEREAFLKMDKTKKWNAPRYRKGISDPSSNNFNMKVTLTSSAVTHLRTFVEEFLDSGFNPLFTHLRKVIEREAERVTDSTPRHFWFVISWFLEAERARRVYQKESRKQNRMASRDIEPDSFSLVASVLNQETFVNLNRYMQQCIDFKDWQDLTAGMKCFTQILLTIQEMAKSDLEEDQEIAENIQSRIFYEETTHDRILFILRNYQSQGFWYLDACTELAHVFLRMLEHYSKQNGDMQIRSRRRTRQKRAQATTPNGNNDEDGGEQNSDDEDMAEVNRAAVERSFDFKRFSGKFCTQKSVDTFFCLAKYYRELNTEQLKRAHRFFYRVAFKQEMSVLLFRVDIISLFFKLIRGPEGLDSSKPSFKDWEELVRHIFKKLIRKLEQRPELIVEMLFSKINSTAFYLEYGHEKQTLSSESRPATELEIKPGNASTLDDKLRIVIAALIQEDKKGLVLWVCDVLDSAANERLSWEMEAEARAESSADEQVVAPKPPSITTLPKDEACRTAMFRNGRLRLLMMLSGIELLGEDTLGASWIVPSSISSSVLRETHAIVKKHSESSSETVDGTNPRELLRRRRIADADSSYHGYMENVHFGSDSEGGDDDFLFPANLPERAKALKASKKKRRRKEKGDADGGGIDEEILEARRQARENNALARRRKIKSDLFVHASDDESDEEADREFFAKEEERRQVQAQRVEEALEIDVLEDSSPKPKKRGKTDRKRKSRALPESDREESNGSPAKRRRSERFPEPNSDEGRMVDEVLTSPSRSHTPPTSAEDDLARGRSPGSTIFASVGVDSMIAKVRQLSKMSNDLESDVAEDDGAPVAATTRRRRALVGLVVDSDSE